MNFSPKTTLVQTQTLSQTQLQSLKILSLDNFELNNFLQNEYIENPLLDYNENSNLPSWNQYVSYSSAKEDEDIYKEIPDFGEWNQRIPSGSVKPKKFFRFTVDSNADHD